MHLFTQYSPPLNNPGIGQAGTTTQEIRTLWPKPHRASLSVERQPWLLASAVMVWEPGNRAVPATQMLNKYLVDVQWASDYQNWTPQDRWLSCHPSLVAFTAYILSLYHWHWTRVSGVFLKFLPDWLSSSICWGTVVGMDRRGFLFRCLVYGWCLLSQCSLDRPLNACNRSIRTEEMYVGAVQWKVICMPVCLCASLILPPFSQQWRCRNRVMELL